LTCGPVSPDVEIRPLQPDDVHAAEALSRHALSRWLLAAEDPDPETERSRVERGRRRIAHLLRTDPAGAWAAFDGDGLAAVALALVREDLWGLSLFAVAPHLQGRGIGARLLKHALAYGDGRRDGLIVSTTDPRAMRRYVRTGCAARPCLEASGSVIRSRIPSGLRSRPGDAEDDRELLDACSRHARGAAHGEDIAVLVACGDELLVYENRGFLLHRDGSPVLMAARDEEAASDLLWSAFAAARPGAQVDVHHITAGNDWALRVALDAGLALSPGGPVFVRGRPGPLAPYLPSGFFL